MKSFNIDSDQFNPFEYFKHLINDLGIELDKTNYNSAKLIYNGAVIHTVDLQEDDDSGEFEEAIQKIKEYFRARLSEHELLVMRLKTSRPIALPESITADEFNWLLNYLKTARLKFQELPPVDVEPLKIVDLTL